MALGRDALMQFIREKLGVRDAPLDDDTVLFSTGMIDSFRMVELIAFIEKQVGSRMTAGDVNLDNLDSVRKILTYLDRSGSSGGDRVRHP